MANVRDWDELSFIDIAVHDGVREAMLAGEAALVFDCTDGALRWANGPAARLFDLDEIGVQTGSVRPSGVAMRQLASALTSLGQAPRDIMIRMSSGVVSHLTKAQVAPVDLPDVQGQYALATVALNQEPSADQGLHEAIEGLETDGAGAAIIDDHGAIMAAGAGFAALGLETDDLAVLADETRLEDDRLVKRMVGAGATRVAAGVGQLAVAPGRYLVIALPAAEESMAIADIGKDAAPSEASAEPDLQDQAAGARSTEDMWIIQDEPSVIEGNPTEPSPTEPAMMPFEPSRPAPIAPDAATPDAAGSGRRQHQTQSEQPPFDPDRLPTRPIRFVWKTDEEGTFIDVSPEFASSVGPDAADLIGRRFAEVAARLSLAPADEILAAFARRDTWSGKSVGWPIQGTDRQVPVDLAALPYFDRHRVFGGYRGFGVARMSEMRIDPAARGLAIIPWEEVTSVDEGSSSGDGDSTKMGPVSDGDDYRLDEPPALAVASLPTARRKSGDTERPAPQRVVELPDTMTPEQVASPDVSEQPDPVPHDNGLPLAPHLSDAEAKAFRTIGQVLGGEAPAENDADATSIVDEATSEPSNPDDAQHMVLPQDQDRVDERSEADEWLEDDPLWDDDRPPELDAATRWLDAEPQAANQNALSDVPDQAAGPHLAPSTEPSLDQGAPAAMADEPAHAIENPSQIRALPGYYLEQDGTPNKPDQTSSRDRGEIGPDTLDGLPLALLIVRGERTVYANAAFFTLTGFDNEDQLNDAGLDALFGGPSPASTINGQHMVTLTGRHGADLQVRAHMQTVPWMGKTALMFAFEAHQPAPLEEMPDEAMLEGALTSPHIAAQAPTDLTSASKTETSDAATAAEVVTAAEVAELHAILDTATDGVILIAGDGMIRSLNGSALALFGYSKAEVEGKSFSFLFAHESQRAAMDYLYGLSNNGVASVLNEGREVLGRERNGGFLPLFMTIGSMPVTQGFCAVIRDITPWKQTEQALQEARLQAEAASDTKSEFLARISHEIRTPLNAIIGFSELMAEERFGPIGNPRYKDYMIDINKSGRHVLDMVNDLLDISKIEAGKQDLEFESVPLNDAIGEAIAMIQPQANRNQIIIRSSLETNVPPVVADLRSIKQIMLNLLSNAVRFTHEGGQVIVSTSYTPVGEVLLRIRDTGIGMSEKELEGALKPFQQVAAIGERRGDGTGLGLPLTKALVEANRAEFGIRSEPGQGTRVDIRFPPARVLAS